MNSLPTNPHQPQEIDGARPRPWRSTHGEVGAWDATQDLYWTPNEEQAYTKFFREKALEVRDQVMGSVSALQEELVEKGDQLRVDADQLAARIAEIKNQVFKRSMTSAEAARELGTLRTQGKNLVERFSAYHKTQEENARIAEDPWAYDDEMRRRFPTLKQNYWPW